MDILRELTEIMIVESSAASKVETRAGEGVSPSRHAQGAQRTRERGPCRGPPESGALVRCEPMAGLLAPLVWTIGPAPTDHLPRRPRLGRYDSPAFWRWTTAKARALAQRLEIH